MKKQILLSIALFGYVNSYAFLLSNMIRPEDIYMGHQTFEELNGLPVLDDACSQIPQRKFGILKTDAVKACEYFNAMFKDIKKTGNPHGYTGPTDEFLKKTIKDTSQLDSTLAMLPIMGSLSSDQLEVLAKEHISPAAMSDEQKLVAVRKMIKEHKKQLQQEWQVKQDMI